MSVLSRGRPQCRLVLLALLAAAMFGSALPGAADGHFERSLWSFRPACEARYRVDPLNIYWYKGGNALGTALIEVSEMGWEGESGSAQWFWSHGGCRTMQGQRNRGYQEKHHTRFFLMPGETRAGNEVVFGDAHRERKVRCVVKGRRKKRDAVYPKIHGRSGFDQGVKEVINGLRDRGHHYGGWAKGPHRETYRQCNGDKVRPSGRLHKIKLD